MPVGRQVAGEPFQAPELRTYLRELSSRLGIPLDDRLGPLIDRIATLLHLEDVIEMGGLEDFFARLPLDDAVSLAEAVVRSVMRQAEDVLALVEETLPSGIQMADPLALVEALRPLGVGASDLVSLSETLRALRATSSEATSLAETLRALRGTSAESAPVTEGALSLLQRAGASSRLLGGNGTVTNPDNAKGVPDGQYAELQASGVGAFATLDVSGWYPVPAGRVDVPELRQIFLSLATVDMGAADGWRVDIRDDAGAFIAPLLGLRSDNVDYLSTEAHRMYAPSSSPGLRSYLSGLRPGCGLGWYEGRVLPTDDGWTQVSGLGTVALTADGLQIQGGSAWKRNADLNNSAGWTVDVRVKLTDPPAGDFTSELVRIEDGTRGPVRLVLRRVSGTLVFELWVDQTGGGVVSKRSGAVAAGSTYTVRIAGSGSNWSWWVDGTPQEDLVTIAAATTNNIIQFGNQFGTITYRFLRWTELRIPWGADAPAANKLNQWSVQFRKSATGPASGKLRVDGVPVPFPVFESAPDYVRCDYFDRDGRLDDWVASGTLLSGISVSKANGLAIGLGVSGTGIVSVHLRQSEAPSVSPGDRYLISARVRLPQPGPNTQLVRVSLDAGGEVCYAKVARVAGDLKVYVNDVEIPGASLTWYWPLAALVEYSGTPLTAGSPYKLWRVLWRSWDGLQAFSTGNITDSPQEFYSPDQRFGLVVYASDLDVAATAYVDDFCLVRVPRS